MGLVKGCCEHYTGRESKQTIEGPFRRISPDENERRTEEIH